MYQLIPFGDSALIIKLGDDISQGTNTAVRKLYYHINKVNIKGVVAIIPSYNELMIQYNPLSTDLQSLAEYIRLLQDKLETNELPESSLIEIPVVYGGRHGPDLQFVAEYNHLSVEEVVKIHSSADYLVYMMGFTPGFCYLGNMDIRIAVPRKKNPRLKIMAGSVGIADQQTGIYPIDSPGGWQIIGQTSIKLFDQYRTPVFLAQAGDRIRFVPV